MSFAKMSYITHYLGNSLVSLAREVYQKNKFEGDTLSHIIIAVITSLLARGNSVNTCVRETENNACSLIIMSVNNKIQKNIGPF